MWVMGLTQIYSTDDTWWGWYNDVERHYRCNRGCRKVKSRSLFVHCAKYHNHILDSTVVIIIITFIYRARWPTNTSSQCENFGSMNVQGFGDYHNNYDHAGRATSELIFKNYSELFGVWVCRGNSATHRGCHRFPNSAWPPKGNMHYTNCNWINHFGHDFSVILLVQPWCILIS